MTHFPACVQLLHNLSHVLTVCGQAVRWTESVAVSFLEECFSINCLNPSFFWGGGEQNVNSNQINMS
jgi:hypothetical protein